MTLEEIRLKLPMFCLDPAAIEMVIGWCEEYGRDIARSRDESYVRQAREDVKTLVMRYIQNL